MSKTIWEFPLYPNDTSIQMPSGARLLTAREQGDAICVWAEVDPDAGNEVRGFNVFGTGHEMPENPGSYLGTAMLEGGRFVFHVYAS